jgi:hypothetical protein
MPITSPKRDFLPSQRADHISRALDETYERGFLFGRAAGLRAACDKLRQLQPSAQITDLIEELERLKYVP